MRKATLFLTTILLVLISCKEKKENEVKYKIETNEVIFFGYSGIKNETAKKIVEEALKDVDHGDYKSAREKFIQADKLESKNMATLNAIAEIEFRLGNTELANKMLLNAILIDSTFAGTYSNLGFNYLSTGYFEKANEILLKGKKFTSNKNLHLKSILLFNLAISYDHLADCENSLKYFNETLEISQNEDLTESANKRKKDSEETICKNKELL